jgi:gliding motility-associated-like protein
MKRTLHHLTPELIRCTKLAVRLVVTALLLQVCQYSLAQETAPIGALEGVPQPATAVTTNYTSFPARLPMTKEHWQQVNPGKPYTAQSCYKQFRNDTVLYAEVVAKRNANESYYINPAKPSAFGMVKSLYPINFQRDGEWIPIDATLHPVGNNQYEAPDQWNPVGIQVKDRQTYLRIANGKVQFNNWTLYGVNGNDKVELATADWSNYTIGADGIRIINVFPGIDAEMRVSRGGIKTSFIIHQFKYTQYQALYFEDAFKGLEQKGLYFKDGKNDNDKTAAVYADVAGETGAVKIAPAFGYVKNKQALVTDFPYHIVNNKLGIAIPAAYITSNLLLGDVVIDPLVQASNSISQSLVGFMYNASCTYANSCDYTVTVTPPAMATVTTIATETYVTVSAPCGRENLAWQVRTGTCYSPAAGQAWIAGGPTGPGTLWAGYYSQPNLVSCAVPSCSPAPMNFIFRLFRTCYGPVGCDNTCMGLLNPLSVWIEGYTAEMDPITISTSASCAGDNITFSTAGKYGVAPYAAVNWSYSSTGTPSLGTGSSITTGAALTPGNYTMYANTTDACGTAAQTSVNFTVKPLPVATTSTAGETICHGAATNIVPSSTISGTTYSWTVAQTGVTGASAGSGTSIVQTLSNTGTAPGTAVYTITPTGGNGCTGLPITYTVTVNPVSKVLYVDGAGGNDANCGDAWNNALQTLSKALQLARLSTNVDSILVAKGTYYPTGVQTAANRDSSFVIVRGKLKVSGGYPNGGGPRDIAANATILSGDIGALNDTTDNSYHVMVIAGNIAATEDSIVIDGFTITQGNANGAGQFYYGSSQLYQGHGGGMFMKENLTGNKTVLRNLDFVSNTAAAVGGGLELNNASPAIQNCSFTGNHALQAGGGIANETLASPTVTNTSFTGNVGNGGGGGVWNNNPGNTPSYTNCRFTGNMAIPLPPSTSYTYGGAMNNQQSTITVTNCIFTGNRATGGGGAVVNDNNAVGIFNYCVFDNNLCLNGAGDIGSGGALQISNSGTLNLNNCTLVNNRAGGTNDDGGGAIMLYGGTANCYNLTLYGNTTQSTTKPNSNGISTMAGATMNFNNSISWGGANQLHILGAFNYNYSLVRGTAPALPNLDLDPQFVNAADPVGADGVWGTADDGLQLTPCSPAAQMGSNALVPASVTTDMAGAARIVNTTVDMGAYELQVPVTPLTFTNVTKTYGDADAAVPNFTNCSGLPVTFTIANTALATMVTGNLLHIVKAGTTTITAHIPNGTPDVTVTLTINPKPVTISLTTTPVTKVYDGNTNATVSAANLQFAAGDVVGADDLGIALSSSAALYDTKDVGTGKTVTVPLANVSLTGTTAGNYTITNTSDISAAVGVITPLAITITAAANTKVYGDADPALTYTYTPALAPGDAFTGNIGRAPGENVGTYAINQNTLALSSNYTVTYVGNNFIITPKTITVTADAKSKVYGDADPALTYTYTPALVTGDAFTGNISRVAGENVGAYAINQNTLALSSNYTLVYTGNTFTITRKTITVTVAAQTKVYGDADPTLTYTYSPALVTGDAFTGNISRTPGENAGTYAINQNTLALSGNYTLIYTGNNLTITRKTITVTVAAQTKVYGDADPSLTYTYSPALVTGDAFTGAVSRTPGENVGTYAINQNTLTLSGNYTLIYTGSNLTITPKTITVTAAAKTKVYGDADPALTYTFTPALVGGDVFTGNLARWTGENAGTYFIIQGTLSLSSNYQLVYVSANLVITKAPLTVTVPDKTICLSDVSNSVPVTYSGFKRSDNAASLTKQPLVTIPAYTQAGTYTLTASGGVSNNYDFTYVDGVLIVLPVPAGSITQLQLAPAVVSTPGYTTGVQLTAPAGSGYTYAWSTGETTASISVKSTATFSVVVTNSQGCATRFTTQVIQQTLVIPNIFSPNGDNIHDKWVIENLENYPGNVVQVYNRYGQMVYKVTNFTSWDGRVNGRDMPVGTYYYIIDLRNGQKAITGYIDIIR